MGGQILSRRETRYVKYYVNAMRILEKFAGPTAHWRVGSLKYNPRSFCWFVGTHRLKIARLAGHSQRHFRPLGAPGLDFYGF